MKRKVIYGVICALLVLLVAAGVLAACNNDEKAECSVYFVNDTTTVKKLDVVAGYTLKASDIPAGPVRAGQQFKGWYLVDGRTQVSAGFVVNAKNTYAYAEYTEAEPGTGQYTVTYSLGDYVGAGSAPDGQTVNAGAHVTLPDAPERDGYGFVGWKSSVDENVYGAGDDYTVNESVIFTAQWGAMSGSGTAEDPYVLYTADDLITFSNNVNHPDVEATADWYTAYYRLGADIDMAGKSYTPAGSRTVTLGESRGIAGFCGVFDGGGHTISNLSISVPVRETEYVGLFGLAYGAIIRNVKIEDAHLAVESFAAGSQIRAYVGAIAGAALNTSIYSVSVEADIATKLLSGNLTVMGGVAGMYQIQGSTGIEIRESSNIYSNVNVHIDEFDSGSSESVLDSAYVGGVYGMVSGTSAGLALINTSAAGSISGKVIGGIIGYISADYSTVVNAVSTVDLHITGQNTSEGGSPCAGGIVGEALADMVIMDCFADSDIFGVSDATIGGIIGVYYEDEYVEYLVRGTTVLNCYYSGEAGGSPDVTDLGEKVQRGTFNEAFATDQLQFAAESWSFDAQGRAIPDGDLPSKVNNGVHTVTLVSGSEREEVSVGGDGYDLLNYIDAPDNIEAGKVFWDWQFDNGADYRPYVPVIKDITLTAKSYSVEDIVGTYNGKSNRVNDIGIILLGEDGSIMYLTSSTGIEDYGTYRYDGTHFIADIEDGTQLCGTLVDGVIEYIWTEGSIEVTYTFTKTEEVVDPLGEYFSADGDLISFTGVSKVTMILNDIPGTVLTATYTKAGNTVTLGGLDSYYSSATITVNADGFEANFVGGFDDDGYSLSPNLNKQFSKLGKVDYSDKAFIGLNNTLYMNDDYQEERTITFHENGTVDSSFGSVTGRYYVFGDLVRIIIDGYVSTFTYDEGLGIMYGTLVRGTTAKPQAIIAPAEDGDIRGYIIGKSRNNVVFVTNKGQYYMKNGALQAEAVISGDFEDGGVVNIDGKQYLAAHSMHNESWNCYTLTEIDDVYGAYTVDGKTYHFNGVDTVSGDMDGMYLVKDNYVTAYNLETGEIVSFDYVAAKAAGNVGTAAAHDGYQGIWYNDKSDKSSPKYYAIIIDGHGTTMAYSKYSGEYSPVWGNDIGHYSINANGSLSAWYNSVQLPVFTFHYGKQIFVVTGDSMTLRGLTFYKDGYDGPQTEPTFDENKFGKYTGDGVELELKSDLTGTYNSQQFSAGIDDNNKVVFTVDGVEYTFDADALTLTHDGQSVSLTAAPVEPAEDPVKNTVWKGTLKKTGNYGADQQEVEISFTDTQVTIKYGNFEFTANYTYSSARGISVNKDDFNVSGNAEIDSVSLKLEGGKLSFSIAAHDVDEYFDFAFTATLEKQETEQEEGGIEGVYVGTLSGDNGMNGHTVTITLQGDSITLVIDQIILSGTYTYDEASKAITTEDLSDSAYTYEVEEITLKFEEGVLKLTLQLCYDYESYFDFTADLNKQSGGQEAADPITNTVWKGKLTKEDGPFAGVDGEDVEISFDGTQVTIKMGDAFEFKANYTYSSDSGISVNKDDFNESSDYAVTAITLNIVGGQIEFSISIEEQYDYYRFTYSSTLQKQSGGQEAANPVIGTYSGKLSGAAGLKGQTVQIILDADAITLKIGDSIEFTANYTYSEDEGIKIVSSWSTSGMFSVEDITITYADGEITLNLDLYDDDMYETYNYEATLTK